MQNMCPIDVSANKPDISALVPIGKGRRIERHANDATRFFFVASSELGCLTSEWFYLESSKKYKRCGSAKVVRELHRRGNGAGE